MTRAILEACRHRIANDDMALGREPSPVLAEIDAELSEPKAEGAHSTGPWLEGAEYGALQTEICAQDRKKAIATVWTKRRVGVLSDEKAIEDDPEGIANLHLVLAAPAMLAALEHAAQNMPHPDQMVDDAIRKARGRE